MLDIVVGSRLHPIQGIPSISDSLCRGPCIGLLFMVHKYLAIWGKR